MTTIQEHDPTVASEEERAALTRIEQALANNHSGAALAIVDAEGAAIPLPMSLLRAMRQVTHALVSNHAIAVLTFSRELTTQEASDILNVSRPFLIKRLLDTGEIPFTMTGAHRRIAFDDLMAYKRRRDQQRRQTLRELSQASQQAGLK
jgi:excisionase family DNA binding protein